MKKGESLVYGIMSNMAKYIDDSEIQRAKQEEVGKKKSENVIYTLKLVMNKKPLILSYRIGSDLVEILLTDKKTGKLLEYFAHNGKSIEVLKKHNFSPAEVKKMLESGATAK